MHVDVHRKKRETVYTVPAGTIPTRRFPARVEEMQYAVSPMIIGNILIDGFIKIDKHNRTYHSIMKIWRFT